MREPRYASFFAILSHFYIVSIHLVELYIKFKIIKLKLIVKGNIVMSTIWSGLGDFGSGAKYLKLAEGIRQIIANGTLEAHQKLPAVRELAYQMGLEILQKMPVMTVLWPIHIELGPFIYVRSSVGSLETFPLVPLTKKTWSSHMAVNMPLRLASSYCWAKPIAMSPWMRCLIPGFGKPVRSIVLWLLPSLGMKRGHE
ncbi:MAG: GntR family transcriptional regulator [Alphaproteobacteria bacterium]|nr:GntR family transcriptional regulator [Alphaproteobacteria bacterium]